MSPIDSQIQVVLRKLLYSRMPFNAKANITWVEKDASIGDESEASIAWACVMKNLYRIRAVSDGRVMNTGMGPARSVQVLFGYRG